MDPNVGFVIPGGPPSDLFLFRPLKPSWDHVVVPESAFKNDPKLAQTLVPPEHLDAPMDFI